MLNRILVLFFALIILGQSEEEKMMAIFEKWSPSVVFINTVKLDLDPFEFFFDPQPTQGIGSGFIFDAKRGLILTNSHVIISPDSRIIVTLQGGEKIPASLVGKDEQLDVAVLKLARLPDKELTEVALGTSSSLKVGRKVIAIGNPFGLDWTMTSGIVSAVNRVVRTRNGLVSMIQTDAAINPGSSGGPLFDLTGLVVGINTQILSKTGMFGGISFAVPIDDVKRVVPDLLRFGRVRKPFIGWVLQNTKWGVAVRRVLPGSPADEAGLNPLEQIRRLRDGIEIVLEPEEADYIIEFDGQPVKDAQELSEQIMRADITKPLSFLVRSGLNSYRKRRVFVKAILK
ncbi:MAG: trypsin-like peptidase domain-containing protein [Deltaproteobacteria bacterium]|nr:trypsin-like peptidase domain-containing protein [Deltaproteobacteria bacterium]MCX7953298.1 trypsin-like peptidase domain-containing protein [Deltaproteobacteria bacterium]